MNRNSKSVLLTSLMMVVTVAVVIGVLLLGSRISGFGALITLEAIIMLVACPRLLWMDYKFKEARPNVISMFTPFYNVGLIANDIYYRLTQVFIVATLVIGLLAKFNRVFSFLPINVYLNLVDCLKYGFFGCVVGLFIITGLGAANTYLYYNSLHKLVLCENENSYGVFKVLGNVIGMSNIVCCLVFIIPVVRVIPFLMFLEKMNDLDVTGFTFSQLEEGIYD